MQLMIPVLRPESPWVGKSIQARILKESTGTPRDLGYLAGQVGDASPARDCPSARRPTSIDNPAGGPVGAVSASRSARNAIQHCGYFLTNSIPLGIELTHIDLVCGCPTERYRVPPRSTYPLIEPFHAHEGIVSIPIRLPASYLEGATVLQLFGTRNGTCSLYHPHLRFGAGVSAGNPGHASRYFSRDPLRLLHRSSPCCFFNGSFTGGLKASLPHILFSAAYAQVFGLLLGPRIAVGSKALLSSTARVGGSNGLRAVHS